MPYSHGGSARVPGGSAPRPENVRALERGLAIITAFDARNSDLTLSEVSRATGLPRAVVRRFLYTLEDLGYVRTDGKTFSLRPRVLQLGYAYLSSFGLPQIARTHLEDLVAEIDESVALGVLDDKEIVYVARAPSRRMTAVSVNVGKRFPAHATSMGRVLLAGQPRDWLDEYFATTEFVKLTPDTVDDPTELYKIIDRAGRDGWAMVDQELEPGLRAIAVPVRDGGDVIAAVNVSVHADRNDGELVARDMVPRLQRTAHAIERDLEASSRR
jgi:IclR family transcriptional regulator, pca regulon regulatory protein